MYVRPVRSPHRGPSSWVGASRVSGASAQRRSRLSAWHWRALLAAIAIALIVPAMAAAQTAAPEAPTAPRRDDVRRAHDLRAARGRVAGPRRRGTASGGVPGARAAAGHAGPRGAADAASAAADLRAPVGPGRGRPADALRGDDPDDAGDASGPDGAEHPARQRHHDADAHGRPRGRPDAVGRGHAHCWRAAPARSRRCRRLRTRRARGRTSCSARRSLTPASPPAAARPPRRRRWSR